MVEGRPAAPAGPRVIGSSVGGQVAVPPTSSAASLELPFDLGQLGAVAHRRADP